MSTATTTSPPAVRRTTHYVDRWIFVGLLALPAYGLLTFASSSTRNRTPRRTTPPGPVS